MGIQGWYYLHDNGDLIYRLEMGATEQEIRKADFACAMWPYDPGNREGIWSMLVEALSLGANAGRIRDLAAQWNCNEADARRYAEALGIRLYQDGNWRATRNGQALPAGSGASCLAAMASLCKGLGYRGGKSWHASFAFLAKS